MLTKLFVISPFKPTSPTMSESLNQTLPESTPSQVIPAARAFVAAVERMHVVLGAVVAVAAVAMTHAAALGSRGHWTAVLAGLVLGGGNFHALAVLTTRMLLSDEPASRNTAIVMLMFKIGAVAALMFGVFQWLRPDGMTLILAMSLAPLCLIVEALRRGGRLSPVANGSLS
jgi:hypothetical protein